MDWVCIYVNVLSKDMGFDREVAADPINRYCFIPRVFLVRSVVY